jgi:FkbM family methyltransferase
MLKPFIKHTLHRLGYDFRRYDPAGSDTARFMAMLAAHHVNLVLDVGANGGDFARFLREQNYRGRIVSFEPLRAPWTKLSRAAQEDPLWEVAPRAAIGASDGEIEMHVSRNLYSSSALNVLASCVEVAPDAAYVGREKVPLRRLDTIGSGYLQPDSVLLIKADVQGFEQEVLDGAPDLLKTAVGLYLELSLVPLYEGQCSYEEMIVALKSRGFEMWNIVPELIDHRNGRLLQVNATFFRN